MTLLPDTLLQLANQGATLRVDARNCTPNQLNRLAAAIAESGGRLAIAHAGSLSPQQAQALAVVGGNRIEFDLTV